MTEAALAELPEDDVRPDERFAVLVGARGARRFKRIAETSLSGIGLCLLTLREEGQFGNADRVGILDRRAGQWLIYPGGVR